MIFKWIVEVEGQECADGMANEPLDPAIRIWTYARTCAAGLWVSIVACNDPKDKRNIRRVTANFIQNTANLEPIAPQISQL